MRVEQFLSTTPLWNFFLVPPPKQARGECGKGSGQHPATKGKVCNSRELQHLWGSLTKHIDICRKVIWTPTNYFPLLIPHLYLEVQKLHWLVWVLSQCCELSAFIYLLNLLYSSSSKWVTLAFFVLSTVTSPYFNIFYCVFLHCASHLFFKRLP